MKMRSAEETSGSWRENINPFSVQSLAARGWGSDPLDKQPGLPFRRQSGSPAACMPVAVADHKRVPRDEGDGPPSLDSPKQNTSLKYEVHPDAGVGRTHVPCSV